MKEPYPFDHAASADALNAEIKATIARAEGWLLAGFSAPPKAVADVERALQSRRNRPSLLKRAVGKDRSHREALANARLASIAYKTHPNGTADWLRTCLEAEPTFDGNQTGVAIAYDEGSQHLVIEYDVPAADAIPRESSFKYVKATDELTSKQRSAVERNKLYASLLAKVTLRLIHSAFTDDCLERVTTITFSAYTNGIDIETGQRIHPCLLTVRTTREHFTQLQLSQVDPIACLRSLNATVSRSAAELVPVRPISQLDLRDRRFVTEEDVVSTLDSRPNLMDLTPSEFESLITNLFSHMGLEPRLTQASRDGGVDCVAFDLRPVLGGKVVIQAKRYAGTVGVSAVRDLYGTVLNEGASKGILVTTSGYGPAAFEFASNKPLELLSGPNLLALLAEWSGVAAVIQLPVPVQGD